MEAKMKIPVKDLSPEWVADIKEKYPNQAIEVKVMPTVKKDLVNEHLFWKIIALLDWSQMSDFSINSTTISASPDATVLLPSKINPQSYERNLGKLSKHSTSLPQAT